jgi:hypothetical protein
MVSNELGFVFVSIPHTGYELFKTVYGEKNGESGLDDSILLDVLDYEYVAIVKNPYHRAVDIWKNGCDIRKEQKRKQQTLGKYFENHLNRWDYVVEDLFDTQVSYMRITPVEHLFHYEDLVGGNWSIVNKFLKSMGSLGIDYYADPDRVRDWKQYYEDPYTVEVVNYMFEKDFEFCKYPLL